MYSDVICSPLEIFLKSFIIMSMLGNIIFYLIIGLIIAVPIALFVLFAKFMMKMSNNLIKNAKAILPMVEDGKLTEKYTLDIKDGNFIISNTTSNEIIYTSDIKNVRLSLQQEYIPKETETTEKDKSVIGRAVVGGILLGPVGAIVGGMSGIGTKKQTKVTQKEETKYYLLMKDITQNKDYLFFVPNFFLANLKYFMDRYKREGGS